MIFGTRTAVQACSGVSSAWCPQRRSRLMPRCTHRSNLSRCGARCHGAALSATKCRRGAARQSAATSMARFLVNCSSAAVQLQRKQNQSPRLDPYVSHREGSIVVLPAANLRGPPDKYGLLTLGRPSVRCYSTLRAWSPVCGSTLRVSHVCNCLGSVSDLPSSRRTSLCWKG